MSSQDAQQIEEKSSILPSKKWVNEALLPMQSTVSNCLENSSRALSEVDEVKGCVRTLENDFQDYKAAHLDDGYTVTFDESFDMSSILSLSGYQDEEDAVAAKGDIMIVMQDPQQRLLYAVMPTSFIQNNQNDLANLRCLVSDLTDKRVFKNVGRIMYGIMSQNYYLDMMKTSDVATNPYSHTSPAVIRRTLYVLDSDVTVFRITSDRTCLTPDTLITMGYGNCPKLKLSQVKAGDLVLGIDPQTGSFCTTRVRACDAMDAPKFAEGKDKWEFYNEENKTSYQVETLHRHRLYNIERQAMAYLDEWKIGEHTLTEDGSVVVLRAHTHKEGKFQHLTLFTDTQTYFANGLLAGNRQTMPFTEKARARLGI